VHFTSAKLQESAGLIGKEAPQLYTLSRDGALFAWTYFKDAPDGVVAAAANGARKRRRVDAANGSAQSEEEDSEGEGEGGEEGSSSSSSSSSESESEAEEGGGGSTAKRGSKPPRAAAAAGGDEAEAQSTTYAGGHWRLTEKHYFGQRGARLTAAAFQGGVGLLAAGFSSGIFELLQLPDLTPVHTLSIGRCALQLQGCTGAVRHMRGGSGALLQPAARPAVGIQPCALSAHAAVLRLSFSTPPPGFPPAGRRSPPWPSTQAAIGWRWGRPSWASCWCGSGAARRMC
jgi:periodic tryptophan protein 2